MTTFGGERVLRIVVADNGRTVVVCNEQEFHRSNLENRSPEGIAFPRKDVSHGALSRQNQNPKTGLFVSSE